MVSLKDAALRTAVLKAVADALKAEAEADRHELFAALVELYKESGAKSLDVRLPDGTKVATISLAIEQSKPVVTDHGALLAWALENRPEWCREIPARTDVAEAAVFESVEFTPDGQAVTSDGEIVPGVAVTPGGSPRNFSVRFETHGRSAIAAAWSDGRFGGALPGMAPALPEVRS